MHTSAHEEDMQVDEVGQRGIGRKLEKKCEPLSLLNKQRFLTPAIKKNRMSGTLLVIFNYTVS